MKLSHHVITLIVLGSPANGFTTSPISRLAQSSQPRAHVDTNKLRVLSSSSDNDINNGNNDTPFQKSDKSNISNMTKRMKDTKAIYILKKTATAALHVAATSFLLLNNPQQATASAPVTPIKNFKPPDSKAIALKKINDSRNKEKMKLEMAHQIKCDEIEETRGKAARIAYEREIENQKIQQTEERSLDRLKLLYSLVDRGVCPFVDVDGVRQVYIFDHGIDLNKVPATAQQKEMMNLRRDQGKLAKRREKERFIVKCIVDDQKLQGNDPLEYLEKNQMKTKQIMNLKDRSLDAVVEKYKELVLVQGSLSGIMVDVPFDMVVASGSTRSDSNSARNTKANKLAANKKLSVRGGEKADDEAALALAVETALQEDAESETSSEVAGELEAEEDADKLEVEAISDTEIATIGGTKSVSGSSSTLSIQLVRVSLAPIVGVVGVGGAGYAFMQNSKAANEKEEIRKRQFEALMKSDNEGQKDEDEGVVGQDDLIKLIQRTAAPKNEKPSFPVNHQEEEVESSDSSTSAVEEGGVSSFSI
jgi:hypothetical protein